MAGWRLLLATAAFTTLGAWISVARADSTATAQDLFDRGLAELKLQHFALACPALRESHRLDPQAGTLFTLAECEARAGQVASAWLHFDAYLESVAVMSKPEQQRQAGRVNAAKARRDELRPQLPYLTIGVAADVPADAVLYLDDAPVPRVNWNVPLPTDPGARRIKLVLSDGRSTTSEIALTPGASLALSVALPAPASPALPMPEPPAPPPNPERSVPIAPAPVSAPPPKTAAAPVARGHGAWTYAAFGVGAAGLLTGSVAGAILISKRNTVSGHCDGNQCDDSGYASTRNVPTLDLVANVGFGVGLVGAAIGVVLLVTDHDHPANAAAARWQPRLAFDRSGASAGLAGAF